MHSAESAPLRSFLITRQLCFLLLSYLPRLTMCVIEPLSLIQTIVVSRHSVRTPMAAPFADNVDNISAYSNLVLPTAADWGLSQAEMNEQYLTPRGKEIARLTGKFFYNSFTERNTSTAANGDTYSHMRSSSSDIVNSPPCNQISVFSDGAAFRDYQTAIAWLEGYGCTQNNITVQEINSTNLADMQPVVATAYSIDGCNSASEEQINGLYGGNVDALTNQYASSIRKVEEVLQMPAQASICTHVNPSFKPTNNTPCTLFELGYAWNGLLWDGMFYSPLFYAQYFAEAWMLQYLSNLSTWAWGALSDSELVQLYEMHIKTLWFGTSYWNSQAYGSQLLGYILSSLKAAMSNTHLQGIEHDPSNQLVAFFAHDANILYLQRLLGASWLTSGWPFDVAATASAVRFELFRDVTGEYFVQVSYISASPKQQRSATSFTNISVASVVLPHCGALLCTMENFTQLVLNTVDVNCMIGGTKQYIQNLNGIAASRDAILVATVTGATVLFLLSIPLVFLVSRAKKNNLCSMKKQQSEQYREQGEASVYGTEQTHYYQRSSQPLLESRAKTHANAAKGKSHSQGNVQKIPVHLTEKGNRETPMLQ